jgi:hypothetical protein
MKRSSKPTAKNEGEGNRTADRNYRAATAKFIKSGRVGPAAREAARALSTPEGKQLKKAESAGRVRARS